MTNSIILKVEISNRFSNNRLLSVLLNSDSSFLRGYHNEIILFSKYLNSLMEFNHIVTYKGVA
jgi:hypothetical protein